MRLGIRYRLLIPLGLLLIGVIGASLWSANVAARRAEQRVAEQVRNVSRTLQDANFQLNATILYQMRSLSGAEFVYFSPDGPALMTFQSGNVRVPPPSAFDESKDDAIGLHTLVDGDRYRCQRVQLRGPSPNSGGVVYIFYPESLLEEAIADAQRPSLWALAFGLIAIVFTFAIAQRLVGRIRALEKRTRLIAAGDFSPMSLPRANDELRDLSVSVNEMADRLAKLHQAVERTERLRLASQLATGLAHQLNNSVTGAKLALQVYQSEHPKDESEAIAVTLRQLALMESNLRRFIDLGRPGESKRESVSLNEILTDVADLFQARAKHAGIELKCDLPPDEVRVEGNRGQLSDVFVNLLGNACDAVGSGGKIELKLFREGKRAAVAVVDSGPGPLAAVAGRLFEPFVTGKPEGIGLGLAVVKQAVEAHGGTIEWKRANDRTIFHVELPAA